MATSPRLNRKERFTYADYLTWLDDERWEIIDGVAYSMSPAPGTRHQRVSRKLSLALGDFLRDKTCEMFTAPFDVRLSEQHGASDNYIETVVQPDILVVCDKSKLDERGCNGVPDLIIEILSPSTAKHDTYLKFNLYQKHGVKEYWLVHPNDQTVLVFKLQDSGIYGRVDMYVTGDVVPVSILVGLEIDLGEVFAE